MELKSLESEVEALKIKIEKFEDKTTALEFLQLLNKRKEILEKISVIKWNRLSLQEKILKRKEDFSLTFKYYEKFEDEVKQKFLYKKNYVRLVDIITFSSFESPLLIILLKSLNTSMYVDLFDKDCNIHFIIEELEKMNNTQLSEVVSCYKQILKRANR